MKSETSVVIPAFNEADNIEIVIQDLKKEGLSNIIVGVDKNTTDNTDTILNKLEIPNIRGGKTGYDSTVLAALNKLANIYPRTKYVLFADAGRKYSFSHVVKFLEKLENGADMVLGLRSDFLNTMLWHQKFGTQMVLLPINIYFKKNIKDISPFRLVRYDLLKKLNLTGAKFRLPTEMLVKALALNAKIEQVEVRSLKRLGKSKVSGSLRNSVKAGLDMFGAMHFINYKNDNRHNN